MYTDRNFQTKKAVKDALAKGETVHCHAPSIGTVPINGTIYLEGPHYPAPHTWYGQGVMRDGRLVSIK